MYINQHFTLAAKKYPTLQVSEFSWRRGSFFILAGETAVAVAAENGHIYLYTTSNVKPKRIYTDAYKTTDLFCDDNEQRAGFHRKEINKHSYYYFRSNL